MKKIAIAGIVLAIIIIGVLVFRPETEKNVQKTADFPPPAPTGLLATPGVLLVNLSWDPVPSANTYNIYWSTESPVTMSDQNRIASVSTRFVHSGLAGDTVHYYIVTAVNAHGESPPSREVSSVTWLPAAKPQPAASTKTDDSSQTPSEADFQKQLMNRLMNSERPHGEPPDEGAPTWDPNQETPPPPEEWPDVGEPTWDPNLETPPPKSEWPGQGEKPHWSPDDEPQRSETPF